MKNYKLFIILGFVLFFWMTFGSNSGVKIKPRDSPPTFIPFRPYSDISLTYNPVRTLSTPDDIDDIESETIERSDPPERFIHDLVPQYMRNYDPHIGVIPLPGTGYGGWLGAEAGISTSDDEFVSDEENLY